MNVKKLCGNSKFSRAKIKLQLNNYHGYDELIPYDAFKNGYSAKNTILLILAAYCVGTYK